jgi:hypothetical protein
MLTETMLKGALPTQMRKRVTPELLLEVNQSLNDPHMNDILMDNILGYSNVLQTGRYKISNYIAAVKYVSYKMIGDTNKQAYCKTYPVKYNKFVLQGVSEKDIATYIHAFNKSKLVTTILAQALVPLHLVNLDKEQEAVNVLADLMANAKSEKVRSDSADKLLTHLRRPEAQKIELEVTHKNDSAIDALREITANLAATQLKSITQGGYSAEDVAHMPIIIEGSVDEE